MKYIYIIPSLFFLFIVGSCTKEAHLPVPATDPSVTTTLSGIVMDETNNPVADATVSAYGKTTTTNTHGFFSILNVSVSPERAYIKVTKTGYFTGSKACIPLANATTLFRITLSSNTPNFTITSTSGGTAVLANGSSVELPVDAVVSSNGSAYSGTIQLAVKHLDPSQSNFDNLMPGDLEAIRIDDSKASLYSYGMLNVELTDNVGQPLKLAPGKSAMLTFAIPASYQSNAPTTIPLWYFDETKGIWQEEGSATLVGTNYVGQVNHFSTWNCDNPASRTTITGKVLDSNGLPVPGLVVLTGQKQVYTNNDGTYTGFVPDGITFDISVPGNENFGITGTPVSVGPFSANQVNTVSDLIVSPPALITGTVVNCNKAPIGGLIIASWTGGSNIASAGSNGSFKIPVLPNQSVNIFTYGADGSKSIPANLTSPSLNASLDIGQITVCSNSPAVTTTFTISGGIYSNTDFTINAPTKRANYVTVDNRTVINISDDVSNFFTCLFPGNTTGSFTYSPPSQYIFLRFYDNINPTIILDSLQSNIPFNILNYDPVGGLIQGTYAGTFNDKNTGTTYTVTNGKFSIIRGDDQ
jgi:hypothetical protein